MKLVAKVVAFPFVVVLTIALAAAFGFFRAVMFIVKETLDFMDNIGL